MRVTLPGQSTNMINYGITFFKDSDTLKVAMPFERDLRDCRKSDNHEIFDNLRLFVSTPNLPRSDVTSAYKNFNMDLHACADVFCGNLQDFSWLSV
jgi:hypothetical protein